MTPLNEILIRNVGDTRDCPNCRNPFIPNDQLSKDTFEMYKFLYRNDPTNKNKEIIDSVTFENNNLKLEIEKLRKDNDKLAIKLQKILDKLEGKI